jgi:hypothetical protein
LLVVLALIALVTGLVTAFGGGGNPAAPLTAPAAAARLLPAGPPAPEAVARLGALTLNLPVNRSRVTAIGYHAASDGALALAPLGHQGNEGALNRVFHKIFGGGGGQPTWYRLSDGATSALDVGATPGTDVWSPVDGTVIGIAPYVVAGHHFGARIDIQPQSAPSLIVSLTQVKPDPSLTVGSNVVSGATRVGIVVDLSRVERQALARYTNDAGNHVSVEVRPAASLLVLN